MKNPIVFEQFQNELCPSREKVMELAICLKELVIPVTILSIEQLYTIPCRM